MDSCALSPSIYPSGICHRAFMVLAAVIVLTGCDLAEVDDEDPIESIAILPDSVSISVGDQVDFSVVGVTASGDTVRDADFSLRWWSTDTTVFTVEDDGLATGQGSGTAYCKVEASEPTAGKRAGKASTSGHALSPLVPIGLDSAAVHLF